MFAGMLLSTLGASMIWPYLMIYVTGQLDIPRATAASLFTINSAAILITSLFGGPIIDWLGRKWVMVIGLLLNGGVYILYGQADTYLAFAFLLAFAGIVTPLYRIGSDAMLADLLPEAQRINGYALLRLANNLGISIGPMLGGFIASSSYALAFTVASSGMILYSLLLAFLARETLPPDTSLSRQRPVQKAFLGLLSALLDRKYMLFILFFTVVQGCAVLIWILLPVHAHELYQVSERLYGLIPTTNAIMVVTLQLFITRYTRRLPALPMMALGGIFYALSNAAIAFSTGYWGFLGSMVVMTIGELILMPTSSAFAANHAPPEKRGSYLSLYGMSWGIAAGIFPVVGGLLNDQVNPQSTWLAGFVTGLCGVVALLWLSQQMPAALRPESGLDSNLQQG